ncbi:hypothetical protein H8F21_14235 [Pseudomonas sp. P66]|uniref:Uncharacterized protein n=1 Tax=Pseudomonas arcuscaelestis TaxID=2710591 RepID=A0ABS2C079_9PSED|nr:hypothetical protein [Pseudomonas arcuscaelestis]MBM5458723.1 hypothetical protein [Pseudomonas arcuscaelestis]
MLITEKWATKVTYTKVFLRTAPKRFNHLELPLIMTSVISTALCSFIGAEFDLVIIMVIIVMVGMFLTYWSPQGKAKLNAIEAEFGPRTSARIWQLCSDREAGLEPLDLAQVAGKVGEQKEVSAPVEK